MGAHKMAAQQRSQLRTKDKGSETASHHHSKLISHLLTRDLRALTRVTRAAKLRVQACSPSDVRRQQKRDCLTAGKASSLTVSPSPVLHRIRRGSPYAILSKICLGCRLGSGFLDTSCRSRLGSHSSPFAPFHKFQDTLKIGQRLGESPRTAKNGSAAG